MPERKCDGCKRQDEWGCTAVKWREPTKDEDPRDAWVRPSKFPTSVDGEEVYACPRQPLRENGAYWNRVLMFYGMFKNGFLPAPGSVIDQSNKAIQLFRIVEAVSGECDEQLRNKKPGPPQGAGGPAGGRGRGDHS